MHDDNAKGIIVANYSIHSVALVCWAKQYFKGKFYVLSVDTGFASIDWNDYLAKIFKWLDRQKITYFHLKAENSFSEIVRARKQFPSQQFSWCAGFIKGISLLNKIDELDPNAEAIILLSHRKDLSKVAQLLKNSEEKEKYDYRKVEYPLLNKNFETINKLTENLPFKLANHSLECQPCIYSTQKEFQNISTHDIKKVIQLEKQAGTFMFHNHPFDKLNDDCFNNKDIIRELSKSCSWDYSCGL